MERREKPAKAKVATRPAAARESRTDDDSRVRSLEQRLAEALEQKAAISEVLTVISRSAADLQSVFDMVVERAVRLCAASKAFVYRLDGEVLRMAASYGASPELKEFTARNPIAPGRHSGVARAALERRTVHIADVQSDPEYTFGAAHVDPIRTVLAIPILSRQQLLGVIVIYRLEVRPFTDVQAALMQAFADQAVIAIENARLFTELQARNSALAEALEQQTATGEILRVISRSPTNVQPVFDTIVAAARKLCRSSSANVFTFDGEQIHLAAFVNVNPEYVDGLRAVFPRPPGRETAVTRAVLTKGVVTIPDVLDDRDYAIRANSIAGGFRSVLAVPLLRAGEPIGAIAVGRPEPGQFPAKQVALLETFADQAVIAIENVRLFKDLQARNRDLTEALEQQTATSEILRVISRSPTDVQPVFDTIASAALKLCGAVSANVYTVDGDLVHLAALVNVNPEGAKAARRTFPRPIGRDNAGGRAVLTRAVIVIPDVLEDADYGVAPTALTAGFRSVLAVPLLRDEIPIGAIAVGRPQPGPFPGEQVALLHTFADQAVIAIENVRLFKELELRNRDLTEALEQQTATGEILRVISSSPTDVQPVFDIIGESAEKLCAAEISIVSRVDGEWIQAVAIHGVSAEGRAVIGRRFPMRMDAGTVTARAIRECAVVHSSDVLAEPDYETKDAALAAGFRGSLGVPMLREGQVIGAIFVARRSPGLFADSQVELLKTFADQAVIAIENVRLFKELEARTRELTRSVGELKALGEVGQAVSSTLDLGTVLSTIVSRATQLAGVDGGAIHEYEEAGGAFYLHTTDGLPDELVAALRSTRIRKGEGAVGRLAMTGEPVEIRDIMDADVYQSRIRDILIQSGFRSLLAVPLLREDRLLGGLVVCRNSPGAFAPEVIDLLKTFAAQSALAIQNARLFREIEDKSRQLETASRHKSEFLANMSHELRTPLNAIIGFSEVLSERMFGEINDKQAEYLADILESGRHLLSLINDILDLSKIEAGRMELEPTDFDVAGAIENTLVLVRERAQRRGITLRRAIDGRLPAIRADERKVKQVMLNLLSNALKFTPEGGSIAIAAKAHDAAIEISVTDTGVGIAPEDQAAVFEEFRQVGAAARKVEGTGLGLAISRKFIELHGGRIWVSSAVGTGSTFAFTLPLPEDRRSPPG